MLSPPFLKKNDTVALLAPAGKIVADKVLNAVTMLRRWQLNVVLGEQVFAEQMGFAGTDEQRRRDLQTAINDPHIAAIICVRGGYGCGRIAAAVDFRPLLQYPKWLVGFSDITVLHAHLLQMGIQSIHGTMPKNFPADAVENDSLKSLKEALFGTLQAYQLPAHPLNINGCAAGRLVGGNLSLVTNLAATPDDIDTAGAILFIEEVGERLYTVDRMMNNLQRSGKLSKAAGIIIGHFSDIRDDSFIFGKTAYDIIADYVKPLHVPVCFGFPAGHEEPNHALYFGRQVQLNVTERVMIYE